MRRGGRAGAAWPVRGWVRGGLLAAGLASAGLGPILLCGCEDDLTPPADDTPPAMVKDLRQVACGPEWVELRWTAAGDDSLSGTALAWFLRGIPGRAIQSETDWDQASLRPAGDLSPAPAGEAQSFTVTGLAPDSTYGFAVRYVDPHGNFGRISPPFTARTAPPPPPDAGTLTIRLSSREPDGYLGARVVLGEDSVLVEGATSDTYSFTMSPGSYPIRVQRPCTIVSPGEPQQAVIASFQETTLSWRVNPVAPVVVTSAPVRGEVWLDGAPTGRATPDTLRCLGEGTHAVTVRLRGAAYQPGDPDSTQTIAPDSLLRQFGFSLEPAPQARTALLEIFTATYCPNCGPADAAVESLWVREGPENGFIGLQSHTRWPPNPDSLATPSTLARNTFYGNLEGSGLPVAMVAGIHKKQGAGSGNVDQIAGWYLEMVDRVRPTEAAVAFHWLSTEREPGVRATGRVRVFCLQDLAEPTTLMLMAASYKDALVTRGIHGVEPYGHVVREYKEVGSAAALGLTHRGDWTDIDLEFLLGNDRRPSGSLWSEEGMGLVVFLQGVGASKEILQAAHAQLP